MQIAPSEAWGLDFAEVRYLFDLRQEPEQDLSLMLNYERIGNGASRDWLGF